MTATDDASYGGASFPLKHPHGVGQVLSLSLPLPRNFRRYDLAETSYKIFALVRNTRAGAAGERVAGVMFIGRVPPKGYETKPGGRYRLPDDPKTGPTPGAERRQHERLQLFVNLRLRRLGVAGTLEEQTVTENVCRGGARVFTTLPVVERRDHHGGRPRRQGGRRGPRVQRLRRARPRDAAQPAVPRRGRLRAPAPRGGRPAPCRREGRPEEESMLNEYARLARPFFVMLAIVTVGRWLMGTAFGVPYEKGTSVLSIVTLTLFASLFSAAFLRPWLGWRLPQAAGFAMYMALVSQLVILLSTAALLRPRHLQLLQPPDGAQPPDGSRRRSAPRWGSAPAGSWSTRS